MLVLLFSFYVSYTQKKIGDLVLRLHPAPNPSSSSSPSPSSSSPLDWIGIVDKLSDGMVLVNWLDGR